MQKEIISRQTVEKAIFDGLELAFEPCLWCILKMAYPGVGTILSADSDEAGILDLAYPVECFAALEETPSCSFFVALRRCCWRHRLGVVFL